MSNARTLSGLFTLQPLAALVNKIVSAMNADATVPTGAVFDWALNTPPPGYVLCYGQTLLSATPYTALRTALIDDGFPHGQDGSGNPKLPDARGRVAAGKDDMGGSAASRLTTGGSGVNGVALGATGGAETHVLTTPQMPSHGHVMVAGGEFPLITGAGWSTVGSGSTGITRGSQNTLQTGGGLAHNNTQPTLVLNKIIKT